MTHRAVLPSIFTVSLLLAKLFSNVFKQNSLDCNARQKGKTIETKQLNVWHSAKY